MDVDMSSFLFHPAVVMATPLVAMLVLLFTRPGMFVKMYLKALLYKCGLKTKFIKGEDGFQFCYCERGVWRPDSPSILFVHGFSASKDMWIALVRLLSEDIHIIAVDLPGHGQTSRIDKDKDISFQAFTERLHQFVQLINLNSEPFHIIGQSMGGAIAIAYCAKYPKEICKGTLICPAMRTPHENEFAHEVRAGHCRLIPKNVEEMQKMMNSTMYFKRKMPKLVLKGVLDNRKPYNDFYIKLFLKLGTDESADQLEALMPKVIPETQVIWGRHDVLIDVSGIEILEKTLPNLKQVNIIEQCGHSCNMDRPGSVVKHILQFRGELNKKQQ